MSDGNAYIARKSAGSKKKACFTEKTANTSAHFKCMAEKKSVFSARSFAGIFLAMKEKYSDNIRISLHFYFFRLKIKIVQYVVGMVESVKLALPCLFV